jgi:hypothetical protein
MEKIVAIFIIVHTLCGCSSSSNRKKIGVGQLSKEDSLVEVDSNKLLKTSLKVDVLKLLHTFVSTEGEILGKLYGKEITDSIYSDFLIIKETKGIFIPIYAIEKATFQNTKGKENLPINNEDFYGYKVLVLVKEDMGIEPLFNINGKILKGDPITVVWDKPESVFKVLITP